MGQFSAGANNAGVTRTPALVVNGDVKSSGKVLSVEDIKSLLAT